MDEQPPQDAPARVIPRATTGAQAVLATVTQRVQPAEAVELARACQSLAFECARWQPSVVFYAERGAGPLATMVAEFAALDERSWPLVPLAIGTATDLATGKLGGLKPTQKDEIIQGAVACWRATLPGRQRVRTALFLDEAQGGGTSSMAARLLLQQLRALPRFQRLIVTTVMDTRAKQRKKAEFHRMLDRHEPDLLLQVLQAPLFTVDRVPLLNALLLPLPDAAGNRRPNEHLMVMRLVNEEARCFFRVLALSVRYPEALAAALARFSDPDPLSWTRVPDAGGAQGEPVVELRRALDALLFEDVADGTNTPAAANLDWFRRLLAHLR